MIPLGKLPNSSLIIWQGKEVHLSMTCLILEEPLGLWGKAWISLLMLASTASFGQRLYKSAYYLGRGDTGIAVADDHEAIYYNPAGVAQGKGVYKRTILASPMFEFSSSTKDIVRKFALENDANAETLADEMGKNQHAGLSNLSAIVFRRAALGVLVSSELDLLPRLSAEQRGTPVVGGGFAANQAVSFTLAEKFFSDNFMMGVTMKYVSRSTGGLEVALAEANSVSEQLESDEVLNSGTGTGADFGLMYRSDHKRAPFSIGLTVQNVGETSMIGVTEDDNPDPLKQTVNIGFAIEPGTKVSRLKLLLDYRDVTGEVDENPLKNINIGTEIAVLGITGLTSGLRHGYATVGYYVDLYVLRMDFGMYTEEVGARIGERPDNRFFFRLTAGF